MNIEETLRLKLALRAAIDRKPYLLSPGKIDKLTAYFIARGDVVTFREDGVISFLGVTLDDAVEEVKLSRDGSDFFDDGLAPLTRDNPKINNGGGAVELTVAQRAAADCGLSDAEFASKDPAFRMSAFDRVQGDTVTPAWRVGAKPRPFAGLSAAEISKMTPEEKLAAADADLFARGRQS
jgi:hypothetical protein